MTKSVAGYVNHNSHLNTRNEPLHPAFEARVLHVRLRRCSQDALPQNFQNHRIVEIPLAHPLSRMGGKNHVSRVLGALLDVLFKLPIRWFSHTESLLF